MSILIDIGANHGQYTDAQVNNFSKVILVEANPFLCQGLEEKYKDNSNISIINAIASNKEEETFFISNADQISTADPEWISNSRFSKDYQWRPIQGIQTISLDSLVNKYPDVKRVKIDVEGYEWNVIQSLHGKVPELCFEWAEEKKEDILKTLTYLHELGFEKFHIQYQDEYSYTVPEDAWVSFDSIYTSVKNACIPARKDYWGMIWAS